MWTRSLRQALAGSWAPTRNWRWMLSSLGIGAGFGLIAGLRRLGSEPPSFTPAVADTTVRVAVVFFVATWLGMVAIRFGRLLRTARRP